MSTPPNPHPPSILPEGLYALVDDGLRPDVPLVQKAKTVLDGGVRVMQLRMKSLPTREALAAAREIVALCRAHGAVCLINDRVDLALLTDADGVHLGDDDLPVEDARRLLGPRALIGRTVRNRADVVDAARVGASYVGLGPIFPTTTKTVAHAPIGIAGLEEVARNSPLPIVAIAGITLDTIAEVARAGAHGAAVGSDLLCARDVAERARSLGRAFDSGRAARRIAASP
ncbi:MAG: thiamine phosphate synthase [Myxococcaceae bacterium]|nr:thiamine phosphate synthase [Myxococcaceae bacterium]